MGNYNAGDLPDNVAKFTTVSDTEFKLDLTKAYNPDWFTANQLTYVTPIPPAVWDVQTAGGKVGDYDRSTDGAKKVFKYLTGEAGKPSEYASNPLWKAADGPFTVKEFTTTGQVTLAKNPKYTGTDAARLDTVTFKPFTSSDAELNVLRSGGVDYGYLPPLAVAQQKTIERNGYQVKPWNGWAITYIPYNFNNPAMGAVFKHLYVRQAVQMSIDQSTIAKVIWHDEAAPGYGPVPQTPVSKYLSPAQQTNPYPFDLDKAKTLLTSHGWTIANGVASCAQPGSGPAQCGAGIKAGTQLKFTIDAQSGSTETDNMMQEVQSSLSKIGIGLSIKAEPLNSVLDHTAQCKPVQSSCSWQLSFFGTAGSWYFPAYPSGEQIFSSTGGTNLGSYVDPAADDLITKSTSSSDPAAMQIFQDPASSLDPRMTVGDCVAEPLVINGVGDRTDRVVALLESVELDPDLRRRHPHELSGGQRQRVGIARALALDPQLVIADEPTSALDVSVQAAVLEMFLELQERLGFACLFITHDLAVVGRVSDRVAVMNGGRLIEVGPRDEVLFSSREEYTRRLVTSAPVPDPVEQRRRREERHRL